MKCIRTEDAVGHVLCHDMTQIIPGVSKGPRFRKGHIVTEEDIPVLLSMGKENLFVWEMEPGFVHENDAAERLAALCGRENMAWSETKEGKIELKSEIDGVFLVDSERLFAVNSVDELMIATRRGGGRVRSGDKLAGTRVIPLVIREESCLRPSRRQGTRRCLRSARLRCARRRSSRPEARLRRAASRTALPRSSSASSRISESA